MLCTLFGVLCHFSHFFYQTFTKINFRPLFGYFWQNSAITFFRPLLSFLAENSATWQHWFWLSQALLLMLIYKKINAAMEGKFLQWPGSRVHWQITQISRGKNNLTLKLKKKVKWTNWTICFPIRMSTFTYHFWNAMLQRPELGTSLFEIALSLIALERTLILGAMALLETKSEALWANWQNLALSGPLLSDLRIKERRKNGWNSA